MLITVEHVSAYTVVRAIPVVNGKWRFSATLGSETPEPIELKFGTIDYVGHPTPQAKTGLRRFACVNIRPCILFIPLCICMCMCVLFRETVAV